MRAVAEGSGVRVYLTQEDPDLYLTAFEELTAAQDEFAAHQADLATVHLQPYRERLNAAEQDVEDALSERLTIAEAEALYHRLYGAILAAKVQAKVFEYTDGD